MLQLPAGTHLVLDETKFEAGMLRDQGKGKTYKLTFLPLTHSQINPVEIDGLDPVCTLLGGTTWCLGTGKIAGVRKSKRSAGKVANFHLKL